MTVVQVLVVPEVVIVEIQVVLLVVGIATHMLCLHSQAKGYRPLQSESFMQPTGMTVVVSVVCVAW
jgi:hypothetical protein